MKITFFVDKDAPQLRRHCDDTHSEELWVDFAEWFASCTGCYPSYDDTPYGEMCMLLLGVYEYQAFRVDSPLAHLHPDYQAQWFNLIVQLPKAQGVYIATNSPVLINYAGHLVRSGRLSNGQIVVVLRAGGTTSRHRYDQDGFLGNWPLDYFLPNLPTK